MARKESPLPRIAPLQRVKTEPISDPAEQASLDELRKQNRLFDLFRELPALERLAMLTQLVAELSVHGRRQLLERVIAGLPADAIQQFGEWLAEQSMPRSTARGQKDRRRGE